MSGSTIDPTHRICDVCGKPLNDESEVEIRVLEVPYHAIEDIRKVDESIADELLQNDGRLAYHNGCVHPIQQYLPQNPQLVAVMDAADENPTENLVACPVCNVPVLKSIGRCGRCGKVIEV